EVTAEQEVIFFMPVAMKKAGLPTASRLMQYWLFAGAPPPYESVAADPNEGPPSPRSGAPVQYDGRPIYVVSYRRLSESSSLLRHAETQAKSPMVAEFVRRRIARLPAPGGSKIDEQWARVVRDASKAPVGSSIAVGKLDQWIEPELHVATYTIGPEATAISAAVGGPSERDAALGSHGLKIYVAGTVTRRADHLEYSFDRRGMRIFDPFDFIGAQPLGAWSVERGMLSGWLALAKPALAQAQYEGRGGVADDGFVSLTNDSFHRFSREFLPRYNRVRGALPPLRCLDLYVATTMNIDVLVKPFTMKGPLADT
ncbi:MAG TPA: DUF6402 family protein, partial [Thermoanaerobaculia bacterium]